MNCLSSDKKWWRRRAGRPEKKCYDIISVVCGQWWDRHDVTMKSVKYSMYLFLSCNRKKREICPHAWVDWRLHRWCCYWMWDLHSISAWCDTYIIIWNHSSRHLMLLIVDADHLANHYWQPEREREDWNRLLGWVGGLRFYESLTSASTQLRLTSTTERTTMNERTNLRPKMLC